MNIADHEKDRFSHVAHREKAAREFDRASLRKVGLQLPRSGVGLETPSERVDAKFAHFGQFFPAHGDQIGLAGGRLGTVGRGLVLVRSHVEKNKLKLMKGG